MTNFKKDFGVKEDFGGKQKGVGEKPFITAKSDKKFDKPLVKKDKAVEGKKRELEYFLCNGPHYIRHCQKKKALNAMNCHSNEEEARVSSMRLLNYVKANEERQTPKENETKGGLVFVEAKVNGGVTKVLVDIGASHNFIVEVEVTKLNIKYNKKLDWMKAY